MSFPRSLGLNALLLIGGASLMPVAFAQTEVNAVADEAPAAAAPLADDSAPTTPGTASAGATKAAICAACHGADGNSADPQYPKLAGQHENYIARHLMLFKSGERSNPIMLGFASMLSPQDMRDIGAHFAAQTSRPGVADDSVIAEGPHAGKKFYQVGEALYRGGDTARGIPACLACHGPDGAGNPGPAYPRLAGQHANYTAAQLKLYRDGNVYGKGDNANAVMSGVVGALSDEEIQSLASYIEGLHHAVAE